MKGILIYILRTLMFVEEEARRVLGMVGDRRGKSRGCSTISRTTSTRSVYTLIVCSGKFNEYFDFYSWGDPENYEPSKGER
jgi:hypothetical protein